MAYLIYLFISARSSDRMKVERTAEEEGKFPQHFSLLQAKRKSKTGAVFLLLRKMSLVTCFLSFHYVFISFMFFLTLERTEKMFMPEAGE